MDIYEKIEKYSDFLFGIDSIALDGYAKAHPEIAEFRKEGAPSVTIRAVGK